MHVDEVLLRFVHRTPRWVVIIRGRRFIQISISFSARTSSIIAIIVLIVVVEAEHITLSEIPNVANESEGQSVKPILHEHVFQDAFSLSGKK